MLEELEDVPGTAFGKSAIKMLIALIPEAEVAYRSRPSQSLAYALNSFITNIRELQQDLDEKAAHADLTGEIMTKVMQPKFHEIARVLADAHYSMAKLVSPHVDKKRRKRVQRGMEDAIKDVGSKLEAIYSDIEKGPPGEDTVRRRRSLRPKRPSWDVQPVARRRRGDYAGSKSDWRELSGRVMRRDRVHLPQLRPEAG